MKVGLVSDTHGYFDPNLRNLLDGVEAIIHAGDVGGGDALELLSLIAPVEAVKGNVDLPDSGLPHFRIVQWESLGIEVVHILPAAQVQVKRWSDMKTSSQTEAGRRDRFLQCFQPSTRAVIFGHTHEPCLLELEGKLFINPGSAGKKRFSLPRCCAIMTLSPGHAHVKILSLEDYNHKVLDSIGFKFGE
jgi:uncharacterized protein